MHRNHITTSLCSLIAVTGLVAAGSLAGCGPTAAGLEARAEAQARLDGVHAQFAYDQAHHEFSVGRFDAAHQHVDRAILGDPENPDAYVLKAKIFLEQHRLEKARQTLEEALDTEPGFAAAHYYLGVVAERWSEREEAYRQYARAFELRNDHAPYLLAMAESAISLGRLEEAESLVDDHLTYFEHDSGLRQLRGQIDSLQGEIDAAVDHYHQARLLNPEDTTLLEELAWMQFEAGMYARCHETLTNIERLTEDVRPDLRHLEARCLTMLQRHSEARNVYSRLTIEQPSNLDVWIEYGQLVWEMGDDRRLAKCGRNVAALAPERHEGYLYQAVVARNAGHLSRAARLLQDACQRAPEAALPHLILGLTLEELNAPGAADAYRQALRIDPTTSVARERLARLGRSP